jgi:hypothetical protein
MEGPQHNPQQKPKKEKPKISLAQKKEQAEAEQKVKDEAQKDINAYPQIMHMYSEQYLTAKGDLKKQVEIEMNMIEITEKKKLADILINNDSLIDSPKFVIEQYLIELEVESLSKIQSESHLEHGFAAHPGDKKHKLNMTIAISGWAGLTSLTFCIYYACLATLDSGQTISDLDKIMSSVWLSIGVISSACWACGRWARSHHEHHG